jgi:hypothetical protein
MLSLQFSTQTAQELVRHEVGEALHSTLGRPSDRYVAPLPVPFILTGDNDAANRQGQAALPLRTLVFSQPGFIVLSNGDLSAPLNGGALRQTWANDVGKSQRLADVGGDPRCRRALISRA